MKRFNKFDFKKRKIIENNKLKKLSQKTKYCHCGAYYDNEKERYIKISSKSKKEYKKFSNHRIRAKYRNLLKFNNLEDLAILNYKKIYDLYMILY